MSLRDELREVYESGQRLLPADAREIINRAARELAASDPAAAAVRPGAAAPRFTLPSADGREISLDALLAEGPVVLTFYRGAWCPYCSVTLRALQLHREDFAARGARLVAVSPQLPDTSLTLAEKEGLDFEVLSDVGLDVAKDYGIAFDLSDELSALYEQFGNELARVNGGHARTLPMPATYVIDRGGVIRWSFVDPDYTVRAEPSDILAALDALPHPA